MRRFQNVYSEAMKELPQYHTDAAQVIQCGKKQAELKRQSRMKRTAAAAVLILICGAGTATAMNYHRSVIEVEGQGYSLIGGEAAIFDVETEDSAEERGLEGELPTENVADVEAAIAKEMVMDVETRRYDSVESFLENEDIVIAIPEKSSLGDTFEIEELYVTGEGEHVMLHMLGESRTFSFTQIDNRASEGYASSTVYMGDSVNERSFINAQGLSYVMFDTLQDGELISTHAVISVNGRDLTMDFYGYEQAVIEAILRELDLSIYFQE